ncbi:hypothetical protein F5883DRAFT_564411 [Diaporthe sp. PMI_573]|nr:hypothetical protein F5883DRAFT_564411 [Diaporthaceae sp. PMI_573]
MPKVYRAGPSRTVLCTVIVRVAVAVGVGRRQEKIKTSTFSHHTRTEQTPTITHTWGDLVSRSSAPQPACVPTLDELAGVWYY